MDARQARKLAAGSTLFGCAVPSGPRVCGFDGKEAAAAAVAAAAAAAATETAGGFFYLQEEGIYYMHGGSMGLDELQLQLPEGQQESFCWQPWHHGWSDGERVDEVLCLCLQMSWSWSSRACQPASLPACQLLGWGECGLRASQDPLTDRKHVCLRDPGSFEEWGWRNR